MDVSGITSRIEAISSYDRKKIQVRARGTCLTEAPGDEPVVFRAPRAEDGPAVSALIRDCPPLDVNSAYCNLLQCTHFAETCIVAERNGEIAGWVSAYRPPSEPDRLFVWQVAVAASARGLGLGGRMLDALLARPAVRDASGLITTVTETNDASWAMFASFARRRGAALSKRPIFERDRHFAGAHDTEFLVSIGPFATSAKETS